jgi:hypothetical protein
MSSQGRYHEDDWDGTWLSFNVRTTGRVRSVPDAEPLPRGEVLIVPGIPHGAGQRPSRVRFMLEGHVLELEWEHGRLASGA